MASALAIYLVVVIDREKDVVFLLQLEIFNRLGDNTWVWGSSKYLGDAWFH